MIFFACSNNKNPYNNKLGIQPSVLAQMDTANYTSIKWADTIYNFGTIASGDSVHHEYAFINSGKTPLFIFNTRITCGCMVTDFPKDPIMPGKPGIITVKFNSGTQTGAINKNILVIANTKHSMKSSLFIRGTVTPAEK